MPPSLLSRLRLFFLALAVLSAVAIVPALLGAVQPAPVRFGSAALALALAAYWIAGHRRGRFPMAAELVEVGCVYLLLHLAPGNPMLPLFGLALHSLYGGSARAWARYMLWMGALLAAHASRGAVQLHGDLGRAAGTALVPFIFHIVRSSSERLEASERRLASLVQNSTDIVTVVDSELSIRWQADSIDAVLGLEAASLVGTPLLDLAHPEDHPTLSRYFAEAHEQEGLARTFPVRLRHRDGGYRHFEVVVADRLRDRSVGGFVLNMRDATERLRLERELRELAARREHESLHDPLTGLANRRKLFASLERAIAKAREQRRPLALLLIDLDRFKELNDTLGHQVGDELLREIRPRLLGAAGSPELVARLGGDEFAVLLYPSAPGEAEVCAEHIRLAIEQPFYWQGLRLLVEASVGIAIYPDHAHDGETLLRRADIAMYRAKHNRLGQTLYESGGDEHSRDRLALLGELPQAIDAGEILLHYQPKFELETGAIRGVEALLRWQHHERGLLNPMEFLPVVEQTGLMRPLTLHIIDQALEQCARWREQALELPVAVNLSAPNLLDSGLPDDIGALLEKWRIAPASLMLEITERIMAADPVRITSILGRLRERGIALSLDDFGTGSSSLSYLTELPVQELKIDRTFIKRAATGDQQAAAVVRTIIALARDLDLRSVAEGIETEEDRRRLCAWGCEQGQGFGLARPMPPEMVTQLARTQFGQGDADTRAAA